MRRFWTQFSTNCLVAVTLSFIVFYVLNVLMLKPAEGQPCDVTARAREARDEPESAGSICEATR
jgi:hypothetical protein